MTTITPPPTDTPDTDALTALLDHLDHLDHFQHRVVQEAFADAQAGYWLRRAADFEAARPRAGDYRKHVPTEELRQRDRRCAAIAQACRDRAAVASVWRLL